MPKRCDVLIVGGAVLTRTGPDTWATKTPFADYVNQLAQVFGRCTWVAPRSQGIQFAGLIDTKRVDVIVLGGSPAALALTWCRLIVLMLQRPSVILYLPSALPLLPVIPIIRVLAARLLVYLAGDYEMTLRERQREPWPGWRRLFRLGFEYPLASADVVIARGRHLAGLARRLNRRVVETVPIGHMNLGAADAAGQRNRQRRGRLVFVGKVLWSKGIGDLLMAIESLRRTRPELALTLNVVGDGTDRRAAEQRVSEMGLDDTVTFHGWIDDPARFAGLLQDGDLVVVPSSTHPEGVPRVIDEAMARGIPVLATRVGGIEAEFEAHEVLLVAPGAPGELAQAIERVMGDPQLYEQLVQGGSRRRQRWAAAGSVARQHADILVNDLGKADTAPRLDSARADSPRVALVTNIFAPYKEPLLAELARRVSLHVYYCAEREPNRQWPVRFTGGYDYTVLPGWSAKVGSTYQHWNPTVGKVLRQYRPDVVIVGGYSYPTPLIAAWTARRLGIPCLLWSGSTRLESSRLRRFTEPLKRRLVPQFDGYIAYTQQAARYLEDLGARRELITVAPVTVDTSAFRAAAALRGTPEGAALRRDLGIQPGEVAILFVGQLTTRKGGDVLLRAVSALPDRSVRLLMVGTGPEREHWQALSGRLGQERRVTWLGHLDQEVLARVYAVSDMMVLPSRGEPSGNVINEAMAAGLPVVISDQIGTDVVRPGLDGLRFAAGDVQALADCIRALAGDHDLRTRLGRSAQQRICSEFTIAHEARQFAEAVRSVLARSSTAARMDQASLPRQRMLMPVKRLVGSLLSHPAVGRVLGTVYRDRLPSGDVTVNVRGAAVHPSVKAMIYWGIYESAERRFVRRYIVGDRDVVELGSSLGVVSSEIARKLKPGRRLICVEANVELIPVIERNVRANAPSALVRTLHAAIYPPSLNGRKQVPFALGTHNFNSSVRSNGETSDNYVPRLGLDDVLREAGVGEFDLVSDIEGGEVAFLVSQPESLRSCRRAVIEFHATACDGVAFTSDELLERFVALGFRCRAQYGRVCVLDNERHQPSVV